MNGNALSIRREEPARMPPPNPADQGVFLVTDRQQRIRALNMHEKQRHIEQQIGEVKGESQQNDDGPGADRQPQKPCEENRPQNPDEQHKADNDEFCRQGDSGDADFEDYKQGQQPTRLRDRLDQRAALRCERNIRKKQARILRYHTKTLDNQGLIRDCRDKIKQYRQEIKQYGKKIQHHKQEIQRIKHKLILLKEKRRPTNSSSIGPPRPGTQDANAKLPRAAHGLRAHH